MVRRSPDTVGWRGMHGGPAAAAPRKSRRGEVWHQVRHRLGELLLAHDAGTVGLELAADAPQANPRSGKLRHVLGLPPDQPL